MTRTKIVATIGPASDSLEAIEDLLRLGVDVCRFNMKHATPAWHRERMKRVRNVAKKLDKAVGIMVDLQGPEIRIETPNHKPVHLSAGEEILLGATPLKHRKRMLKIDDPRVVDSLELGTHVLIDDGKIELVVSRRTDQGVLLRTSRDSVVNDRKGVNIPGITLDIQSLLASDLYRLDVAADQQVEFIALSFIRSPKDIRILREEMEKRHLEAQIVAKIENHQAIDELEKIIEAADAVMVARGDLGIEVPYEQLSFLQKDIIERSRRAGKPVITATEMMASMVTEPRPSRAEVSDVANAVFDGSDAVMLSAETAQGGFPSLAVQAMRRILEFNETKVRFDDLELGRPLNRTESIARAALTVVNITKEFPIAAIVVVTETGATAKRLARYRPNVPIIALTEHRTVRNQLALVYGVLPLLMKFPRGVIMTTDPILDKVTQDGLVHQGDHILIVHGARWKEPGLTNTLLLREVGGSDQKISA